MLAIAGGIIIATVAIIVGIDILVAILRLVLED